MDNQATAFPISNTKTKTKTKKHDSVSAAGWHKFSWTANIWQGKKLEKSMGVCWQHRSGFCGPLSVQRFSAVAGDKMDEYL